MAQRQHFDTITRLCRESMWRQGLPSAIPIGYYQSEREKAAARAELERAVRNCEVHKARATVRARLKAEA